MINLRKETSDVFSSEPVAEDGNRDSEEYNLGGGFEYCKAVPESTEWQAYQIQRVISIKELKLRNLRLEKQMVTDETTKNSDSNVIEHLDPNKDASKKTLPQPPETTSVIPAILKKVPKSIHSRSKDNSNVTWKEPVADTKFLPVHVGWMKVPVVPKLHQQALSHTREKNLTRNKISLVENNLKGKSGIARKQLSINFTEGSGKNRKPHKRNNGKSNLNKHIANVESKDSSTKVNKIGGRNITKASKMKENSSKKFSGMSLGRLRSKKETVLPTGAPATTEQSFLEQTFENESFSSDTTAVEMEEGVVPVFGIKYDQVISDNNNNNKPFPESITAAITSYEINHGKAQTLHESGSDSNVQWKGSKDAETLGVDDAFIYSTYKQDLNENTIMSAPTQKQTERNAGNRTRSDVESWLGMEFNEKEIETGNCMPFCLAARQYADDVDERNETKKFIDFRKESIPKKQLVPATDVGNSDGQGKYSSTRGVDDRTKSTKRTSEFNRIPFTRNSNLLKSDAINSLLNRIKPPRLPELEVCNVLPGTPEWQNYWDDFNQKIGEYYSCVDKYSQTMDALLMDDDIKEYKKELQRQHQDEMALKISMGMTLAKPPLIRQSLKETLQIGGYVIRPLGGAVDQATVSTCDDSFRLEIPYDKLDGDLDGITVDTKHNVMTIAVPAAQSPFLKLVQISVPTYKKVQNLEVGSPLYNGGRLVVIGK